MALNANRLGTAMMEAIDGLGDSKTDRAAVFRALAAAIVGEIVGNAVVFVSVTTTGTATNQAGSGGGSIT